MVGLPQAGTWRHSDLALPVCSGPSTKEKGNEEEGLVSLSPGAGDGNRTRVACLEGRCSTIELHRRMVPGADTAYSRRVARLFRAAKEVIHAARLWAAPRGAAGRIRTDGLLITNQLLYR